LELKVQSDLRVIQAHKALKVVKVILAIQVLKVR
jgi:hypothetical protein